MKKSELRQLIKEEISKIKEIDSYGKIGKQYPAPEYEDELKGKLTNQKRLLRKKMSQDKFAKITKDLFDDASKGLIFISDYPKDNKYSALFVDENSKYKNLLTGKENYGLNDIPYTYNKALPKSEAITPPHKLDIRTFRKIIYGVLTSGPGETFYITNFLPDSVTGIGDMIQVGRGGYVVEKSKFKRESSDYGFPQELGNGLAYVPFFFRN
jgi:hypothetical protein